MGFKRFSLPCTDFERVFSQDELDGKTVVVSIVGKSCISYVNGFSHNMANFVEDAEELFDIIGSEEKPIFAPGHMEGYYDKEENVLYLSLKSPMDMPYLQALLQKSQKELDSSGFLSFWTKIKNMFARSILFMFAFSHIVLLSNSGYSTNSNIIHLFKVLSFVRPKYQAAVSRVLSRIRGISEGWAFQGRLCSPRLIFLFKSCPYEIEIEPVKEEQILRVKKLEHSLEDQIYMAFRKSRLVKNVCSRAFFSIAPNDEFVFVRINEDPCTSVEKLHHLLEPLESYNFDSDLSENSAGCFQDTCLQNSACGPLDEPSEYSGACGTLDEHSEYSGACGTLDEPTEYPGTCGTFEEHPEFTGTCGTTFEEHSEYSSGTFVADDEQYSTESECDSDIEDILDNIGNPKPKPKSHSFNEFLLKHIRKAHSEGFCDNMGKYSNIKPYFEVPLLRWWMGTVNAVLMDSEAGVNEQNVVSLVLDKILGTELKFSTARCKKVLPLALAVYQDSLPKHYNDATHQKKVKQAIAVFSHHARGSAQQKFITKLTDECESIWKNGRQSCEASSLNKNACTKPRHSIAVGQNSDTEHWSGVQFYSSCNCGAKQGPRQDPFTLRAANYDFYQIIGQECGCIHLEKHNFQVYQPDFREPDINEPSNAMEIDNPSQDLLFDFNELDLDSQLSSSEKQIKLVTRHLPGIAHIESPIGLFPQFSSWSLVCRGPSSLYSHNLGLHDQPGFIPGSSYLLPWDVSFRESDICKPELFDENKTNSPVHILKPNIKRNLRISKELISVKIFIGIEYECIRGHRFMSSAPGVVLNANGTNVKEDAHKITEGNMPLFFPCPCGKLIAQLMRVHIVTPKAPVFVTIDPRIRPAPEPCLTFITGEHKPIPLSQSAYWILRLPYVYGYEDNIFSVPVRIRNIRHGEFLGPMYGITQAPEI